MADSVAEIFTKYYKQKLESAMKRFDHTFIWDGDTFKSDDTEAYLKEVGGEGPKLEEQEIRVDAHIRVDKDGHRRRIPARTRKAPKQSLEQQLEDVREATPYMERVANEAFDMVVNDNAFAKEIKECIEKEQRR